MSVPAATTQNVICATGGMRDSRNVNKKRNVVNENVADGAL